MRRSICLLTTTLLRHEYFQTASAARRRTDGELPPDGPHALLDDHRAGAPRVKLDVRQPALERKPPTIIVYFQPPCPIPEAKPDHRVFGGAVFADVGQALLDDADQLETDVPFERHLLEVRDEPRPDPRVAAEVLHDVREMLEQLVRVELGRPHLLHQFAEVEHLVADHVLQAHQLAAGGRVFQRLLAAQHLELHFDTDERLDHAVVQLAGHARALERAGFGLQAVLKVHIEYGRADLADDRPQELDQLDERGVPPWFKDEDAADPLVAERDGRQDEPPEGVGGHKRVRHRDLRAVHQPPGRV